MGVVRGRVSGRVFLLHAGTLLVVVLFVALGWWQLQRALAGNELSWAYTVEWPLFAGLVVVFWWRLRSVPTSQEACRLRIHPAHLLMGGATFDRVAWDRGHDVIYLRAAADVSGARVSDSLEGHRVRLDEGGRIVGLTLVGVGDRLRSGHAIVVTVPTDPPGRFEIDPRALTSALGVAVHRASTGPVKHFGEMKGNPSGGLADLGPAAESVGHDQGGGRG